MAQILLNLSEEKKTAVKQAAEARGLSTTKFILDVLDGALDSVTVSLTTQTKKITQDEINTYFRYARQIQNTLYCGSPRFAKMMGFENIYEFNEAPVTPELLERMKNLHKKYCRIPVRAEIQPGDFPEYSSDAEIDQERHKLVDQHQSRALDFVGVLEQSGLSAFEFQEKYSLTPAQFNNYVMGKKEWIESEVIRRRDFDMIVRCFGKTPEELALALSVPTDKIPDFLAMAQDVNKIPSQEFIDYMQRVTGIDPTLF